VSTAPTTAWLLGHGPDPGEEARRAFTEAELPPGLAEQTLEAVATLRSTNATPMRPRLELHRGGRVGRLLFGSVAAIALVAGVLLSLPTGQQPGDIDAMVPRGQGFDLPGLDLRMAVRQGDVVDRLRADRAYRHGDVFYFRYEAGAEGWIHLVHASDAGIEVLESVEVAAGSADLTRGSEPLAWTIDDSDPTEAVFALVRTESPVGSDDLSRVLIEALGGGSPLQPGSLCLAATRLGLSCDAQDVQVQR